MKNGPLMAIALLSLTSLTAQVLPPTSVPVNKTKTPLLTKQLDQLAQHDLQANFRLFLKYSAKSDFIVKFGDHPIKVPAGEKVTTDFTFEHLPNSSALIHLSHFWGSNYQTHRSAPDLSPAMAISPLNHAPEKTFQWIKPLP